MFGWTILGPVDGSSSSAPSHTGFTISNEQLHDNISKFWEIENVSSHREDSLSVEEAECEAHFQSTHTRDSEGRYVVRLPFKSNAPQLGQTKHIAEKSLNRLIKRISHQPEFFKLYSDFLKEYESLGHMKKVSEDKSSPTESFYLPHHGVLREDSLTTKLRVVFNGSCKSSTGISLNDMLHTGPKLQADIFDVLLYLRQHKFIFTTDITNMFRQIDVHPDDWKFQRILWTDHQSSTSEPAMYDLTTVTYGTKPAPYLACRVLKQLLSDEGHKFPLAIEPFEKGSYVDDITGGADTLSCLNEIASQAVHLKLRPKRIILSETAQLFDPLGLISPVIVRAKILMQDLWLEKIGWDDPLTPQITHRWKTFRSELVDLASLKIPRWLNLTSDLSHVEIHGFSDASQTAMAAAVYIRVSHPNQQSKVTLVCAKTRVAPLKHLTIPRLELSAALLLAKLISRTQKAFNLINVPVTLWTDSSVTLAWINSDPTRWKEFVKNRVRDIHEISPSAVWKFISTKQNLADCASRGLNPSQLMKHSLWWSGPDWLTKPSHQWPSFSPLDVSHEDMEMRSSAVHVLSSTPSLPLDHLLTRCSTLTKLVRVTATLLRAVAVFKRTPDSKLSISALTPADLQATLTHWIRTTQQGYFASEIRILSQGKPLPKSHALSRLTARIDQTGLLRVGGRLQNSQLDEDRKHPPILPKDCVLSRLIIANDHSRTLHGGTQLTLNYIRRYCWIIGGRAPIKSFIQKCVTCTRIRGIRAQQLMGQLPAKRVQPSLVFEHTGVDYAGPVSLKYYQGRGTRTYKAWIVIFICLSTSAVHLEAVTDYSTEGFLKAFRRFTSRRGICKSLTSDCGTNFKGADVTLQQLLNSSVQKSQRLRQILANDGTQWKFNPPGAPHMGGKWEAAVKSVKYHLQRTIADTLLTYEDFSTFLAQVEAVLNSRPLSALTEDPDDLFALTPGHLIRGAPLNTIPEPSLTDVPTSRLSFPTDPGTFTIFLGTLVSGISAVTSVHF
ncbi:uncharacterized protein LOC119650147 [Hermetia illucens]|uniref:uncharacterized protein LOC119650147 n=1 Tax=Hermetia illucens TaxID=343691 RepID=UPI0018CC1DB8|nr:uncharacterized protein LOC119650147 [Hermetia illucens]